MTGRREVLQTLNPLHRTGIPALASFIVGAASTAAGRDAWPVAAIPGMALCIIGVRIAYDLGGAASYLRWRRSMPGWGIGLSVVAHRQIEGAVIFLFGASFLAIAATGVVQLLR